MIKQNDKGCLPVIQKYGCFFRSVLLVVEYSTGCKFTVNQLNELWEKAKFKNIINQNDDLMNSAALMNLGLEVLNATGRFAEVALKVGGKMEPYLWAEKAGIKPSFFVKKIRQGGPSVYHYVVVDEDGILIEDPHEPPIKDLGEVFTICYARLGV